VREVTGIPDDVQIATVIPIGYPERPFGTLKRRPVEELLHFDTW
jgi:nitroreductase